MPTATERRQAAAAAHAERVHLLDRHAGKDLSAAMKVHWKSATFTTFDQALAELAAGITVTGYCATADRSRYPQHKMRFNPDGTVTALDHPDDVYTEGVELLGAMGGHVPTCLIAALTLPGSRPYPVWAVHNTAVDVKLRTLHTAIRWAQVPGHEWSPQWGQTYLRYGITPEILDAWTARGWDRDTAIRFLQAGADPEVADAWLAAGKTTRAAAKLAGQGEHPSADEAWTTVGFTTAASEPWRRTTGFSPADAFTWHSAGFPPTVAQGLHAALGNGSLPLTREELFAWRAAGIPASEVASWHNATGGDLDQAVRWQRTGIPAYQVTAYTRSTVRVGGRPAGAHPHPPLDPDTVRAWVGAGFPGAHADLMRSAVANGVSDTDYAYAIESLASNYPPFDLVRAVTEVLEERARARAAREARP